MQFSREDTPRHAITRYAPDSVRIAGSDYRGSLAITGDSILTDWQCDDVGALDEALLARLVALEPETILLAAGERVQFPDAAAMRTVMRAGVGIEVMNDGAAVRTFNVMLAEGRRVVLALVRAG